MELLSRTAQGEEKKKKVDLETQKESVAQSESGMMSWGGRREVRPRWRCKTKHVKYRTCRVRNRSTQQNSESPEVLDGPSGT